MTDRDTHHELARRDGIHPEVINVSEDAMHHTESAIIAIEDMFEVQARGREIDREQWYLARDHARAAAEEIARAKSQHERLRNVGGYAHLVLDAYYSNRVADCVKHMDQMHRALYEARFPVTNPDEIQA